MDPIYVPPALAAGLKTLPISDIEFVADFAQACLSSFPAQDPGMFKDYVKAVIHALCFMKHQRFAAL